jgi:hypothetical protein
MVMANGPRPALKFVFTWLLVAVIGLAALIYPIYVIRPFRHQGARELTIALAVLRFRPEVEVLCVAAAMVLAVWYFRAQRRWLPRIFAGLATVLVAGFGVLSFINVYELMFHPLDRPSFRAGGSVKLDGDEQVISVRVNAGARAYPIRSISYHHIVNDVVGGEPIVATY